MNQAKLKTYPMTTTIAKPGAVRLPNTLHEHFVSDPRGATSFKQYREDRIWELLQRPAMTQEYPGGCRVYGCGLEFTTLHEALADMRIRVTAPNQTRVRVSLLNGAVVKEWAPTN
jgi:hypothetical protein